MSNVFSRLWQRVRDHWYGPQWRAKCERAEALYEACDSELAQVTNERQEARLRLIDNEYRLALAQRAAEAWQKKALARSPKPKSPKKGRK